MTEWIAERRLIFAPKGSSERRELLVRIGRPRLLKPGTVNFPVHEGAAGCSVEVVGVEGAYLDEVYGADSLQALQLAADVEPILKRLSEKYDLYFATGEPYFDESDDE